MTQKSQNDKERLTKFLFHLGKAVWKSIPVLGNFVDELFFEQYKDRIYQEVNRLSLTELENLLRTIPNINYEKINSNLEAISEDLKQFFLIQISTLMLQLASAQDEQKSNISRIRKNSELIPNLSDILSEIKDSLLDSESIRIALVEIEKNKLNWIRRISKNQQKLLSALNYDQFESIDDIWSRTKNLIPKCGYKEFRFRLHELEWLGLVERFWKEHLWYYRRSEEGEVSLRTYFN